VSLLTTVPGIAGVLGYTIAAEIGDIHRFPTPTSSAATQASGRASTNPAASTVAARSPRTSTPSADYPQKTCFANSWGRACLKAHGQRD